MKRGLVARSCARTGRKDVVREVKGEEMMCVLVAGGARERGVRRLEVKVDSKRRSPGHFLIEGGLYPPRASNLLIRHSTRLRLLHRMTLRPPETPMSPSLSQGRRHFVEPCT